MLVISSREFRINQKKYFDLVKENEQIFVKRGNDTFIISAVNPKQSYNPEIVKRVQESLANLEKGNVKVIKDVHNLWNSLNIE